MRIQSTGFVAKIDFEVPGLDLVAYRVKFYTDLLS